MRSISKTVNDILLSCEPTCFAVLKEPIWSTANAVSVINHDSLILLYFLHHDRSSFAIYLPVSLFLSQQDSSAQPQSWSSPMSRPSLGGKQPFRLTHTDSLTNILMLLKWKSEQACTQTASLSHRGSKHEHWVVTLITWAVGVSLPATSTVGP